MTENPSSEAKSIFLDAVELPQEKRAEFIERACAGDAALRERVERLLQAYEDAGTFMASPTHAPEDDVATPPPPDPSGSRTPGRSTGRSGAGVLSTEVLGTAGPYRLVRRLGEGAYGEVFQGEQSEPVRRSVAVKLLKLGVDSQQVLARFNAERQSLATLDHPNIARFLDAGTAEDGRPYFVMELVRGTRITEHCDANRATVRDRVELLIGACRGVQHAHDMGLVHRDLKPGNILVEVRDDRAAARVIDFGIARALHGPEQTAHTQHGQLLGTPAYMSPEQAAGGLDVDARSDVWSLGCVLYELLVGTTPISRDQLRRSGLAEVQRMVREGDFPPPSERLETLGEAARGIARHRSIETGRLSTLLAGELDWIVSKALARDRTQRYPSAGALADDLQRWLEGRAVEARPRSRVSAIRAIRRSAGRHSTFLRRAGAIALPLLAVVLWLFGLMPGVPGPNELMQRSVESYASGSRYGLPEGAWVNGMKVNRVGGVYALVGGGQENAASRDYAMIGGGSHNTASGRYATIGGGVRNLAEGDFTTVAGGINNRVTGQKSVIGGGSFNILSDFSCTIAGGERNEARSFAAGVGGGFNNVAAGAYSSVAGGRANRAYATHSSVGGGTGNRVGASGSDGMEADGSTVGGGINNTALAKQSVVTGGHANSASANYAAVGGGRENVASELASVVSGGHNNVARRMYATVGGGIENVAGNTVEVTFEGDGFAATVAGGRQNQALGHTSFVGGGFENVASGQNSVVPGGASNIARGFSSFAGGDRARAMHRGAFVWSDHIDGREEGHGRTLDSIADNSFTARCRGGYRFFSALDTLALLKPGEGSWSHDLGDEFRFPLEAADTGAVLDGVSRLRIERFRYTQQRGDVAHMGPSASQFHEVFGLGTDDGHVTGIDLHGVSLAAIQELLARVSALETVVRDQQQTLLAQAAALAAQAELIEGRLEALRDVGSPAR